MKQGSKTRAIFERIIAKTKLFCLYAYACFIENGSSCWKPCDDVCSTKSSTSIWEVGSQSHKAVYGKTRGSNPERTEKDFGFFGERKGD